MISELSTASGGICSPVTRTPTAIGKSKQGPSFLTDAGARLTVRGLRG